MSGVILISLLFVYIVGASLDMWQQVKDIHDEDPKYQIAELNRLIDKIDIKKMNDDLLTQYKDTLTNEYLDVDRELFKRGK